MKLLGYFDRVMYGVGLFFILSYIAVAFPTDIIHPFLLTPAADIEVYNYVDNISNWLRFVLVLSLWYDTSIYKGRVNATSEYLEQDGLNRKVYNRVKKSTQAARKFILIPVIYCIKELLDYLAYENNINAISDCFNPFWFLIFWELLPVAILLTWAAISAYRILNHVNHTNSERRP